MIIPTYQRSDFLARAIRSVLSQSYTNIEIIVVDDNQGEDSFRLATKQKIKDFSHRIKYIEHKKNMGVVQARNTGILNANGDYISFLDDDDEWMSSKLETQLKLFDQLPSSYGLVYCGYNAVDKDTETKRVFKPKYRGDLTNILGINHIGSPSVVLCKREYVTNVNGFNEKIIYREDLDFYYRLSKICYFDFVPSPLVNYHIHSGSESKNNAIRLIGMLGFIKIYSNELKTSKIRWSEIMERLGELYLLNNQKLKSLKSFSEAFLNRPLRLKILAKLLLSILGSSNYIKIKRL